MTGQQEQKIQEHRASADCFLASLVHGTWLTASDITTLAHEHRAELIARGLPEEEAAKEAHDFHVKALGGLGYVPSPQSGWYEGPLGLAYISGERR